MPEPFSDAQLDALSARIDAWAQQQRLDNPTVAAVDRGEGDERRWYIRMKGEQKDTFTIWFTLRQRTLHYETYVMPAPEENHGRGSSGRIRSSERGISGRNGSRIGPAAAGTARGMA